MTVTWIRSDRCESASCTEVAFVGDMVWVRNSNARSIVTRFTRAEWDAFLLGAKDGQFDNPEVSS